MIGNDAKSPIQHDQVDNHLSPTGLSSIHDEFIHDGNEKFHRWSWDIPAKDLSLQNFLSSIVGNILSLGSLGSLNSSESSTMAKSERIRPSWFFLERSPFISSLEMEEEKNNRPLRQAILAFGPCLLEQLKFEERVKLEAELRHSPFHNLSLPIFSDQRDFYSQQNEYSSGHKSMMVPRIALVARFRPIDDTDNFQLDSWGWIIQSLAQNNSTWKDCKPEVIRHLNFIDALFSNRLLNHEKPNFKHDFKLKGTPGFLDWNKTIDSFKQIFSQQEKIVLCRQINWEMDQVQNQSYKQYLVQTICQTLCTNSFANFFIHSKEQISHDGTNHIKHFLCLSPEQLFQHRSQQLQVDVIAGTRPRGKDEKEDTSLRLELRQNSKEIFEHQVVLETLIQQMSQLGVQPELNFKEQIIPLPHVQHLYSSLKIALDEDELDKETEDSRPLGKEQVLNQLNLENLISIFHPTPAVGGRPKIKALNFLKQTNSAFELERGKFAAPIFLNLPSIKVAMVGIRTCEIEETKNGAEVTLKAGAGIVHDSMAKAEWIETLRKMKNFLPQDLFDQMLLQAKAIEASFVQEGSDFFQGPLAMNPPTKKEEENKYE